VIHFLKDTFRASGASVYLPFSPALWAGLTSHHASGAWGTVCMELPLKYPWLLYSTDAKAKALDPTAKQIDSRQFAEFAAKPSACATNNSDQPQIMAILAIMAVLAITSPGAGAFR
jgi:hypothetical protein